MRILFVTTDFVWPAERGVRLRTLSQLGVLAALPEVELVRLFSLREQPVPATYLDALARAVPKLDVHAPVFHPIHLFAHRRYVPRVAWLRLVRGVPYLAGKWDAPRVRHALERALQDDDFDVVWFDGLGMTHYISLVRRLQPRARVVLDQHNVESERFAQFAQQQRGLKRVVAEAEWRKARRFEADSLRAVDAIGAISQDDARAYRELAGVDALFVPQVVPFVRRATPAGGGARLCWIGNLTWRPNSRGLDWFCHDIWPRVRERLPEATLEIAGSGLPIGTDGHVVVPAAWRTPGVTTLGFVPDLEPLYERSGAMVAPLLGGTGVRIKLLEAFRYGIPVVTTPDGAAGLPIESGREAFVETEPSDFARRVVELATSAAQRAHIREAGYAFLERHHGPKAAEEVVRALLGLHPGRAIAAA